MLIKIFAGQRVILIMSKPAHIFSNGRLRQHENTIVFEEQDESGDVISKKHLPVESVSRICFHGQIDLNTQVLQHLQKNEITCGVFGWYGNYIGEFYPRESQLSGSTIVKQSQYYNDSEKRLNIARKIVESSIYNMYQNLRYYKTKRDFNSQKLKSFENVELEKANTINDILGIESTYRKRYYSFFDEITKQSFSFNKRTYNPPENKLNSLISYGNSLLYSIVTSQIYNTGLSPMISYVHQPSERRNSLSLDVADIFKPVIVDRMIFNLINTKQIKPDDFKSDNIGVTLEEEPRELFTEEFESYLSKTIQHPQLNRKVSHKHLIRLDLYKLQKHVVSGEKYQPFKRWW